MIMLSLELMPPAEAQSGTIVSHLLTEIGLRRLEKWKTDPRLALNIDRKTLNLSCIPCLFVNSAVRLIDLYRLSF
jgi:hypothetical protein